MHFFAKLFGQFKKKQYLCTAFQPSSPLEWGNGAEETATIAQW